MVDFKVAGVDDDAHRSGDGEGNAVDGAVSDVKEFDLKWAESDGLPGLDFVEFGLFDEGVLNELFFDQGESEAGAIDWNVEIAKYVRNRADVIFVGVGEDDGANFGAVLLEVGDVGDDDVNAEEFGFGEHEAGVDDDDVITEVEGHHVHAEFAKAAEGDGKEGWFGHLRGHTWTRR